MSDTAHLLRAIRALEAERDTLRAALEAATARAVAAERQLERLRKERAR